MLRASAKKRQYEAKAPTLRAGNKHTSRPEWARRARYWQRTRDTTRAVKKSDSEHAGHGLRCSAGPEHLGQRAK